MAILTPCSCGVIYNLKSEFAEKLLLCPHCLATVRVPAIDKTKVENSMHIFANDIFLLRQRHFSISTKYTVKDINGNDIVFVERPSKYFSRIMLIFAAIFVYEGTRNFPGLIPMVLIIFYFINIKRDIKFYDNTNKDTLLLEVRQNNWFQKKWIRYTLYDHGGVILGSFEKNRFTDFLRRKWCFRTPDNALVLTAQEDSLVTSLLRRVTGYFFDFAILRTNFVFYAGGSEQVVGEFNKKLSLFDRYTLDMTMDRDKLIDGRVALALGVLLDTGEGR
ncbi:MAG: hypothetical protein LLG02_03060 [Pelosinus sp.]|nr:hypothetical protein [Pelosinus sp.]